MARPLCRNLSADWLGALERRKQLACAGTEGRGRAVKMAAVLDVEVGGGAAGERELDEVRVESRGETQAEIEGR